MRYRDLHLRTLLNCVAREMSEEGGVWKENNVFHCETQCLSHVGICMHTRNVRHMSNKHKNPATLEPDSSRKRHSAPKKKRCPKRPPLKKLTTVCTFWLISGAIRRSGSENIANHMVFSNQSPASEFSGRLRL